MGYDISEGVHISSGKGPDLKRDVKFPGRNVLKRIR